jgi:hypothetical protein
MARSDKRSRFSAYSKLKLVGFSRGTAFAPLFLSIIVRSPFFKLICLLKDTEATTYFQAECVTKYNKIPT